jgi:hypothetical protein
MAAEYEEQARRIERPNQAASAVFIGWRLATFRRYSMRVRKTMELSDGPADG